MKLEEVQEKIIQLKRQFVLSVSEANATEKHLDELRIKLVKQSESLNELCEIRRELLQINPTVPCEPPPFIEPCFKGNKPPKPKRDPYKHHRMGEGYCHETAKSILEQQNRIMHSTELANWAYQGDKKCKFTRKEFESRYADGLAKDHANGKGIKRFSPGNYGLSHWPERGPKQIQPDLPIQPQKQIRQYGI